GIILHIDGQPPVSLTLEAPLHRQLKEPITEYQVYGPQIMFTDALTSNIALVRKFIRNSQFKMKGLTIGTLSHTRVAYVYIEGHASPKLIEYVDKKLHNIRGENLISAGQIARKLTD